jgi:hypothetical protein
LRVYPPAPKNQVVSEICFKLLGLHSCCRTLHGIEDVNSGLDEGR